MSQYKVADIVLPINEQEGYEAGDQSAHRAALAMGDRFDAPTIIALTDMLSYLMMRGGQASMTTVRDRVGRDGLPVADGEPGEYRTLGLTIFYETRDAKLQLAKPPERIQGIPVEDFDRPPTEIDDYSTLGPEQGPTTEELEEIPEPAAEPLALTD
jgi:hypothetical protein